MIRVAVLTVSDGVAAGARKDEGGPSCEETLRKSGIEHRVVSREVLPDEPKQVARAIRVRADVGEADLILLTGGTGVAPRDRTPEGVREAIDFEVPGLAEKMRFETSRGFSAAYLSRQVAGVRKKCLVISLPGSPKGAADCLAAVLALVPHAIALIQGEKAEHPPRGSRS
ncbi:MAG TPA: MogA/MoaB family molybdenum cofactor biosynthesis protein [Thermoanaerobaculia bacterium]|jgi:molybdenum cofactor synthesis domain-containing protein